jgi:hypothetical protein
LGRISSPIRSGRIAGSATVSLAGVEQMFRSSAPAVHAVTDAVFDARAEDAQEDHVDRELEDVCVQEYGCERRLPGRRLRRRVADHTVLAGA